MVAKGDDGARWLCFRMVRESPYQLRDCKIRVSCGLVHREDGKIRGCTEEVLSLQSDHKSNLETWFVRHRIDATSPLSNERQRGLAYMNVALTVFDTAHMEEVRIYHNYNPGSDMVSNGAFDVMKSWEMIDNASLPAEGPHAGLISHVHHVVDHSKLDSITMLPV